MQGAGGATIGGANMWALLDKDPGNSTAAGDLAVDVLDRKLKKTAATVPVEVAKPAKRGNMVKKEERSAAAGEDKRAANVHDGKVQIKGAVCKTHALPHGDKMTNSREELKETLAALPSKEEAGEAEVKEEVFEVVAARGGRRRTVAARTGKAGAPVAEVITGTNMWDLLSDGDPGHGGANPAKPRNKTKTKKKNTVGRSSKETVTVDDDEAPASELYEKMSEEEEEMTDQAATGRGICRTVASYVFRAAATVAVLAAICTVLELEIRSL